MTGDSVYGHDELRRWLEEQGRNYVLADACTHLIWTAGRQEEVQSLAATLAEDAWTRLSAGMGSQGPRWYDWACLRLPYDARSGMAHWLLMRRDLTDPTELAYYRVYAPAETAFQAMVRVAGMR